MTVFRSLDGSRSSPSPHSSTNSSQDSLHNSKKAPKKKGLSLSSIFRRKEKQVNKLQKELAIKQAQDSMQSGVTSKLHFVVTSLGYTWENPSVFVVFVNVDSASSPYMNMELGTSDSLSRGLGKETEFDRRKKKKYVPYSSFPK